MSPEDQVGLRAFLDAARGREVAVVQAGEPGRPFEHAGNLTQARVDGDGVLLDLLVGSGKPLRLAVEGIASARPEAHPWSDRAWRLDGSLELRSQQASPPLLGLLPRPPRVVEEAHSALWIAVN